MNQISRNNLPDPFAKALIAVEEALANSHCPCSGLHVSAGWVLADGRVITGVNFESASYGLTLCAERTALARAQTEDLILDGVGIVISATSIDADTPLTPCGACRQWLAEVSSRLQRDFPVYSFIKGVEQGLETSAVELLPAAFDLKNLPNT